MGSDGHNAVSKQSDLAEDKQGSDKTKVTYYVSDETAIRFDAVHFEIRQQLRSGGRKLNKSELADAIIRMVLDDFAENGAHSKIFHYL